MIAPTQTNSPFAARGENPIPSQLELATARIKAAGLRITQPRLAIICALGQRDFPVSIEQIHEDVGEANCDLVTVYRCMAAFERIGLVVRAFFHNGTALYKLNLGQPATYHVVCKATDRVEELDPETSAELQRAIEKVQGMLRDRGYDSVGHIVEFFGISPDASRATACAATSAR